MGGDGILMEMKRMETGSWRKWMFEERRWEREEKGLDHVFERK